MRSSTSEGWYVLSIIAGSFRRFRGKKPAALRPVNAHDPMAVPNDERVLDGEPVPASDRDGGAGRRARRKSNARVTGPETGPTRSIVLLAGAGFASQAMVRVTDSLLP